MHGVELVDAVIARVRKKTSTSIEIAKPTPVPAAKLAALKFPNGTRLSPALARWLAFDASWLGWKLPLTKQSIGDYAKREYEMEWGYSALPFEGDCFGLDFGSDSRRLLYVGEPDSTGEHPVLLTDTDDDPYLGVEYPGIDVYLGVYSGVIGYTPNTYGDMIEHPVYGARTREHAKRYFGGKRGKNVHQLVTDDAKYDALMRPLVDKYWGPDPAPAKPKAKAKAKAKRR